MRMGACGVHPLTSTVRAPIKDQYGRETGKTEEVCVECRKDRADALKSLLSFMDKRP